MLALFLACAALATAAMGCATTSVVQGTTLADARRGKGTGSAMTYEASFDAVWDAAPKVIHDLGLAVAGDNRQEGYVLAERGGEQEKVAVFIERSDETHTKMEVVSRKALATGDNDPDWGPQIIGNMERKLKDPSWESRWMQGDVYLALDARFGNRDIPVRTQTASGEEFSNGSFGGISLGLVAGYDINRDFGVEIGAGYSEYNFSSCDWCFFGGNVTGEFTTRPVTVSLLYHFYRAPGYPPFELHLGGGIEYHLSPKLVNTQQGVFLFDRFVTTTTTVHYDNALGSHVGIGASWGAQFFFAIEAKYVFGLKYKARDMDVNGAASEVSPAWRELDGDGALAGFRLGCHF